MGLPITQKKRSVSYAKWGYVYLIPFFVVYAIFSLYPLISTFYYSFFERYNDGRKIIGPTFIGLDNYSNLFSTDLPGYFGNTIILWLLGFIPQIIVSLALASWFTDLRLKLKGTGIFKTVIYLPNMIMAAAFSMLFFSLFSDLGPINNILTAITGGVPGTTYHRFLASVGSTRGLIALMNFLMWYGNTTIILMAGIMGIDTSLYEAAQIDGANSGQTFRKITLPLLKPILLFVFITSLIGGIQMFDIPQILTNGNGNPNRTSLTVVMYLNKNLFSKNFGVAGAISVVLFFASAVLSVLVYLFIKGPKSKKGGR